MITNGTNSDQVPPSSQDAIVSETQEPVEGILFRSVNFYLNPFLGAARVAELESVLCRNGALKTSVMTRHGSNTTHIFTDDLDFPDYKHAKARGISIVTPEWVYRSLSADKLEDTSLFSADPDHIFSGVVLTTTGLPQYDRQLIRDALEQFGGRYETGITPGVTHVIALAASGDKYDYIKDHPELKIKVVLPTWFQYCCNLSRRIPETVYTFPDPPMLDPSFDPTQLETGAAHAPQLYSNSVKSVVSFLNSPSPIESQFLQGKYFILIEDLNIIPDLRSRVVEKIENAGGVVMKGSGDYAKDLVDIVICRYRSGALYTQASMDGKTVASADWLLHVLQTGIVSSPKASLLHYPIPNEPIKGMTSLVITISNYTGSIREYIKRMVLATGATYKPTLSSQAAPDPTTHIICGNASGEKYEKGQEWNVKVVNHLWIEDCFLTWIMQSETRPRYTTFPPHSQLSSIFGSKISPECAEDWYLPVEDEDDRDVDMAAVKHEERDEDVLKANAKPKESPSAKRKQTHLPEAETEQKRDNNRQQHSSSGVTSETPSSPNLKSPPLPTSAPAATPSPAKQKQASGLTSPVAILPVSPKIRTPTAVSIPASSSTAPLSSSTSISSALADPAKKTKEMTPVEPQETSQVEAATSAESATVPRYRQRGAAMEAAKALKKIVPDMNTFQDELRDEKKASKKKKRTTIIEETREDEFSDMEGDGESGSKAAKAATPSSPAKRKRVNIAPNTMDRSTPAESDEDEVANSSRDDIAGSTQKAPAKKAKHASKSEKERETVLATTTTTAAAAADSSESAPSTQSGSAPSGKKDTAINKQAVRFISTGLPKEPSAKQLKALKALGIAPTTSIERSTHLVAKGIARTEKFLVAVAQGKTIVHEDWLQACIDRNSILDEDDYRIRDAENEDKFGMDLYKSLGCAREKRVFEGYIFYISPSVVPKPAALKTLVEAGGGRTTALLHTGLNFLKETILKSKKKKAEVEAGQRDHETKKAAKKDDEEEDEEEEDEVEETIAVISCEDDREMWPSILEAKAHVFSHELIILGILKQHVDLGKTHALA